jgi:hypothetical protein
VFGGFFHLEATMQRQPMFVRTSRGYLNLARVLYIKPPERGLVRFVFSDHEYVDIPEQEFHGIESTMMQELIICVD